MTQYQHYIPQFILRNFSHPYEPPQVKESKKRCRAGKGKSKGSPVLNVADISYDEPQLLESPVSRWFGQEDMYNDAADVIRSKKVVEQELSKLESRTAQIFHKIKKAHENNEAGIWLTRVERNTLRKFLFIMKYRGLGFYEKYISDDPQQYSSEDRHLLWAYMIDNKMASPRDVWLQGLRAILDLNMDAEEEWMIKLPKVMFPADAQMFIFHAQSSYMAFCTPKEEHDEFVLTDQCYNVFEGPTSETFCAQRDEYLGDTYLCYHEFGPVSPRLIIVLRSSILPETIEDMNPKTKKWRQTMFNAVATQFRDPRNIKSILYDLPVAKATNSYTRVVHGRLELAPGASETRQSDDKFCFRFWPISTQHVDIINSVFLDNLLRSKSIVFGSMSPFKRTLEAYMATTGRGFKTVNIGEHGARVSRLSCLEKLSAVLKMLGSTIVPIWSDDVQRETYTESFDDVWLRMMGELLKDDDTSFSETEASPFWHTYYILGGSRKTFFEDLDQSWRLYKLQTWVYILTMDRDYGLRQKARMNVSEFLIQQSPRRVWLYVKHRRWMLSSEYAMHQETYVGSAPLFAAKTKTLFRAEQEDEVVRNNYSTDQRRLSTLIIAAGVPG